MARPDPYLPWPGNPRRFYAVAMPNGDAKLGIEGHLVFVQERREGLKEPGNIFTRAEAEALHAELGRALRAFDLAKELAVEVAIEVGSADRPTAYTGPYPIRGATLADVGFMATDDVRSAA